MSKKRASQAVYVVPPANREHIKNFRLLDDIFMRQVLMRNRKGVQDILRIVIGRDDIVVKKVSTQKNYANAIGRSVQLDVLAEDSTGKLYNIEIQRDSKDASPQRARYYLSAIDWNNSKRKKYKELPEVWVIFITEKDLFAKGEPYTTVERTFPDGTPFNDGQHIRYVNAAYVGDDLFGLLMADFRETNPRKMHFQSLAGRALRCKETEKGITRMSRMLDKEMDERERKGRIEGERKGKIEGKNEERARIVGVMLASRSPEALLQDPQFLSFGFTQADIAAAMSMR